MTDPRGLTDAALAAIGERNDKKRPWHAEWSDVDALLDHIAWQAEQLAEAERERDAAGRLAQTQNKRYLEELETERADHAATLAVGNAFIDEINKGLADLATEKAARVAAEGQAAEMRTALEQYADTENWDIVTVLEGGRGDVTYWDRDGYGYDIARAALASPDRGASAVLAAADSWESDREKGGKTYVAAILALAEAVRTWRARRSGGEGG